jgi:hypothetical protein
MSGTVKRGDKMVRRLCLGLYGIITTDDRMIRSSGRIDFASLGSALLYLPGMLPGLFAVLFFWYLKPSIYTFYRGWLAGWLPVSLHRYEKMNFAASRSLQRKY